MKKTLLFAICFIIAIQLSGCLWPLLRLIVPRLILHELISAAIVGTSRTGTLSRIATLATLGRASSFAFVPSLSNPGDDIKIHIISDGKTIGTIKRNNDIVSIYGNTKYGKNLPYIRSIKTGKKITHYDFNGRTIGHTIISNDNMHHYTNNNSLVGYDKLTKNAVIHYDRNNRILFESTIIKDNGEYKYEARKFSHLVVKIYTRHLVFNNKEVNSAYNKYIGYINSCYNGYTPNYHACDRMLLMQNKINYLIRKYQ